MAILTLLCRCKLSLNLLCCFHSMSHCLNALLDLTSLSLTKVCLVSVPVLITVKGIVCYEHNGGISIYRQASVWYGKVPSKSHSADISVAAPCPFCHCTNSVNNLVPLNQTAPTSGICRGKSHGVLCGTCEHGIIITSHTFKCCTLEERQAISASAAWASWVCYSDFLHNCCCHSYFCI